MAALLKRKELRPRTLEDTETRGKPFSQMYAARTLVCPAVRNGTVAIAWRGEVLSLHGAAGVTGVLATWDEEVAVPLKWAFIHRRP